MFEHPGPAFQTVQLPAGTVEAGEPVRRAALREAVEETGLTNLVCHGLLGWRPATGAGQWMVTEPIEGTHLRRGYLIDEAGPGPTPATITARQREWAGDVPRRSITKESRRYLYGFSPAARLPDAWPYRCDCGASVRMHWIDAQAGVVSGMEQSWLEAARRSARWAAMLAAIEREESLRCAS